MNKNRALALLTIVFSFTLHAHNLKIGYTNAEYILSRLPEARVIESQLKEYEGQLQRQLQYKYEAFQAKAADFKNNAASMNEAARADKERELQSLQENIQTFKVEAEAALLKKRNQLLAPAVEKVGEAIRDVAEAHGFQFVFSSGAAGLDVLLFAEERSNITDLVMAKLGIDPPEE
ncbi:OmpH family outer membrane protein [Aestuariibacter halophilus]|uniref:OmpH family outer membrane protein n=1 Tax=Fluctibacter halophilus TaxID=226011 RepID=A0ABS8G6E6_9ALTE|nr:OmpH family outer membrane protein [Aestuariibacter halophilus]MCC2616167.1 OmpH family outer membrane protein [Aestuariibacter halophilus]